MKLEIESAERHLAEVKGLNESAQVIAAAETRLAQCAKQVEPVAEKPAAKRTKKPKK